MIGFPEFILDPKELDDVYDGVSDAVDRPVDEERVFLFKGC